MTSFNVSCGESKVKDNNNNFIEIIFADGWSIITGAGCRGQFATRGLRTVPHVGVNNFLSPRQKYHCHDLLILSTKLAVWSL